MKSNFISGNICYRYSQQKEARFLDRALFGWHILDFITGKPYHIIIKSGSIEMEITFNKVRRTELEMMVEYLKLQYSDHPSLAVTQVISDFQALLDKQ